MAETCNPFLAVLQKRTYLKYWKDEIDEFIILVNGRNWKIREFIVGLWESDEKTKVFQSSDELRQGECFNRLYRIVNGDILITLDDDNFIYKNGIINRYSEMLEKKQYDSVGSFGFHATPQKVAQQVQDKYKIVRLNPFMSFWKTEIINKMEEVDFKTLNFKKGDSFSPIGEFVEDGWLDIMAKFSLMYFEKAPKHYIIPQKVEGEHYHIGAMSSLYRRCFRSLENENKQSYNSEWKGITHIYYLANYYAIYQSTKAEVPRKYADEFFKGLLDQIKVSDVKMKEVVEKYQEIKKLNPNLFI